MTNKNDRSSSSSGKHMAGKMAAGNSCKCTKCNKFVSEDDKALECHDCSKWAHTSCLNVTAAEYRTFQKYDNVHWYCDACKLIADDRGKANKAIASLEAKIDLVLTKVEDKCSRAEVKDIVGEVMEEKMANEVAKQVEAYISEKEDVEKRKKNIMMFNVPESESDTIAERIDHDKNLAESVFLLTAEDDLRPMTSNPKRFGKREAGKNRPLRVTLDSHNAVFGHLKKSSTLKELTDLSDSMNFAKKVVLAPDLTVKQRQSRKSLVDELKERRENGEQNLKIFRGRIVTTAAQGPGMRARSGSSHQ